MKRKFFSFLKMKFFLNTVRIFFRASANCIIFGVFEIFILFFLNK